VDRHTTPLTIALIAINVAVFFIGELVTGVGRRFLLDGSQFRPAIENGEWWRVFSAMFLHNGFLHIMFNMWALWLFGPSLERRYGTVPFATLYLAAGLGGGALFHLIGRHAYAVGASGAIFGLFGALLVASYRRRHTPVGRAIFGQLGFLLVINLTLPLVVRRIAWEAHVGGLLVGLAIAAIWDRIPDRAPGTIARRALTGLSLAAVSVAVVLLA
jgi:membrane associated rhomboid family serine protease